MSESVELSTIIEAILFSAGRSMTVEELMEQTGKTRSEISGSLNNLQSTIMSLNDEALMNTLSCTLGFAGYPCGENPINIVSLSLATSGLALLMVS